MKHLRYSFATTVEFSEAVGDHSFVLRCMPATRPGQTTRASVALDPPAHFSLQRDGFGNMLVCGSIELDHDSFSYRSFGEASVDAAAGIQEPAHPAFRFPGTLTRPNDEMLAWLSQIGLARFAAGRIAVGGFAGEGAAGGDNLAADDAYAACEQLMHAIHDRLRYEPGATSVHTTAAEAFAAKAGVCQDYAHIMVTLLRAAGIPARYICGITEGEGATHAWAQAHIDGAWHGFDPTRNKVCDDGYLMIACGRDWEDCPVERGVFRGSASQTQTVFMEVMEQ